MKQASLFRKIFGLLFLLSFIVGFLILMVSVSQRTREAEEALIREHRLLAQTAAQIIESGYLTERWPYQTLRLIAGAESNVFLWVVEPNGKIFFANDPADFGQIISQRFEGSEESVTDIIYKNKERIKLIQHSLNMSPRMQPWNLLLGVSLETVRTSQRQILVGGLIIFLALIIGTALCSLYLANVLSRPLRELQAGVQAFGQGQSNYRVNLKSRDEIGQLATTFNLMADDLSAERARLQEEQEKSQSIITHLNIGLIVHDRRNRIFLINPQAEMLLGVKGSSVIGKIITAELAAKDPGRDNLFNLIKLKPKNKRQDLAVKYPEERFLQVSLVDLTTKAPRGTGRSLVVVYDITREKEVEHLKSEFISIASHQLRTPLSAIKWILKMLLNEDLGALSVEQKTYVEKTYRSNERMISLVNDLLDASRIEEGRYEYKFEQFDLKQLLKEIVEQDRVLLEKNHLEFKTNINDGLPAMVWGDAEKLILALTNLIDNAIKFTLQQGKISLEVKTLARPAVVQMIVRDTGIGISKPDQARLFTKFFRADNAKKMQAEGTGLGLFIAGNIIKKHGGNIQIESEVAQGTTVTCTFPRDGRPKTEDRSSIPAPQITLGERLS